MPQSNIFLYGRLLAAFVLVASLSGQGSAQSIFTSAIPELPGWTWTEPTEGENAIYAGQKAVLTGMDLIPGQALTFLRGPHILNPMGPVTVAPDGSFKFEIPVDDQAAAGIQPIVVIAENPAAAKVIDLKISSRLPPQGEDRFAVRSAKVEGGQYLYQVAYSKAENALFVTSSVGRPPIKKSALLKLDPETFETMASVTPAGPAPVGEDGYETGLYAVYGVGVDDAHGNVWTTNTRQDSIAVYRAKDLALVKQFDLGAVPHGRDVVVDGTRSRVYASASGTNEIAVFDTATLEPLDPIEIETKAYEGQFKPMALDIDPQSGMLFTVSLETSEAAVIDPAAGTVRVIPLPGIKGTWGVAHDARDGLLFAVSLASDKLLIVDVESGQVRHEVALGAGPLNVAFEPESRLAFVATRDAGTITVLDTEGKIVANIAAGPLTNQLRADGRGNVYAVNQSTNANDPPGDRIWHLRAKQLGKDAE